MKKINEKLNNSFYSLFILYIFTHIPNKELVKKKKSYSSDSSGVPENSKILLDKCELAVL